ncbi:hypothetical protein LTR62_000499 [Meristemomyces frigidus]|uniref:Uncharacterized protein n=1 Tax=Meristemomyces frigidus TaxID=1508187 RepID=A0AAN7TD04_9PEZI|nr:hypothetical protein LTR62_000499 [Meristemomyces frigidus]
MLPSKRLLPTRLRPFRAIALRQQSTYQPPTPPQSQQPNPHSNFYKVFGRPLAKTFLIAVATYQILYFSWSKLESMEIKDQKETAVRLLEGELKGLVAPGKSSET